MMINSSIFKLLGWYNFMYVVLLYVQRNLNLLDFVIGTWGIIGFICVNDQSYGQGMNLPDFRGSWKFWSGKFCGAEPLWIYKGMAVSTLGDLMLGIFLAHKLQHKKLTFYFLVFIFHKDLMKILYFPKQFL